MSINNFKGNFEQFAKYISEKCHEKVQNKYFKVNDYDDNAGRFILTGNKGAGKTIAINFLMSCMAHVFDENKVIYIRVDLARPLRTWSVHERFEHQSVLIFKEKYLDDDQRSEFNRRDFEKFLARNYPGKLEEAIVEQVYNIRAIPDPYHDQESYMATVTDATLNKIKISSQVFKAVQQYCIIKEYAFLFILDGLDRLRPDIFHEERFNKWLHEAFELFYDGDDYLGGMIFSMRNESYREFIGRYVTKDHRRRKPKKLILEIVEPSIVVKKRFECYELLLPSTIDNKIDMQMFHEFFVYFITKALKIKNDRVFIYLLQLLSNDMRLLMKSLSFIMQRLIHSIEQEAGILHKPSGKYNKIEATSRFHLCLNRILQDKGEWNSFVEWRGYSVLESLVVGKKNYINNPFNYYIDDKKKYGIRVEGVRSDNKYGFFPNLFDFSETVFMSDQGVSYPTFCKIRTLQLLAHLTEKNKSNLRGSDLRI